MSSLKRLSRVPGLTPEELCLALVELAGEVPQDQAIVEIGVYQGRTACYLAHGARKGGGAHVYAIDPWDLPGTRVPYGSDPVKQERRRVQFSTAQTWQRAVANVRQQGMREYVTLIKGFSVEEAADWDGPPVGLLYIDGDHHYDAVMDDFEAWRPHLADGAVVAFDDYAETHPEVVAAVDDLLARGGIELIATQFDRLTVTRVTGDVSMARVVKARDVDDVDLPDESTVQEREFAPADDVFETLESVPGINDDLTERDAAREKMEREEAVMPPRSGAGSGVSAWRKYAAKKTGTDSGIWEFKTRNEIIETLETQGVISAGDE